MAVQILAADKSLIEVNYIPGEVIPPPVPPLPPPLGKFNKGKGFRDFYSSASGFYYETGQRCRPDYYSDGKASISALENNNDEEDLSFLRVKLPSGGSFFEEQEISAYVKECPCK